MDKKYLFLLSLILLGLIFTTFILLTENNFTYDNDTLLDHRPAEQIVFSSSWGGYDTKAEVIEELLSEFQNKWSGYEIINNSIGGEDFLLSLKTDFASGNSPDVFGLWPGSDIELLVKEGKVQPLDEILAANPEWYSQFGENAWDYVTYDNQIYGLPFELIYEGLFINEDILRQHSLSIPTTFDELLDLCQNLRRLGYIPIAINGTPEGSFLYQNMVMSLGGKQDVENPFNLDGTIKSCFVDALYYLKALYEVEAFPNNYYTLTDQERNQLFLDKEAVMIVQGSWFIGDYAVPADSENVEIIPFPVFNESKADPTAIIYGCGNGVYHLSTEAYNDADKQTVAIDLLKHLTSQQAALNNINTFGGITNIQVSSDKINAPLMYYIGNFLVSNSKELIGPVDSFIQRSTWENTIVKQIPLVLDGNLTPEELFEQVRKGNSP